MKSIIFYLLIIGFINASKTSFSKILNNEVLTKVGEEAIYSAKDSPVKTRGSSMVTLSFKYSFTNAKDEPNKNKTIGMLNVINTNDVGFKAFGYQNPKTKAVYYCCTENLKKNKICSIVNGPIIGNAKNSILYFHNISFTSSAPGAKTDVFSLGHSEYYYYYLLFCDNNNNNKRNNDITLNVNGSVIYKNGFGFLGGESYRTMECSYALTIIYVILLINWFAFCLFTCSFHTIQVWILIVLIFCVIDTAFVHSYYDGYNKNGSANIMLFLFTAFIYACRKTISRIFFLFVTMGFGTTRPAMGQVLCKATCFGMVYITMTFFQLVVFMLPNGLTHSATYITQIFTSILDSILFYWLLKNIKSLQVDLETSDQAQTSKKFSTMKYLLYLMITFSVFVQFVIFGRWLKGNMTVVWRVYWFLMYGGWEILFLVAFLVVMCVFRPSRVKTVYMNLPEERRQDDEEYLDLEHAHANEETQRFIQKKPSQD